MNSKQALVVPHDPRQALRVLGADVRFLCEAEHTATAFSLMEVMLPQGAGPPPHHHDWDEAYYVADGQVRFQLGGSVREVGAGDFLYAPAGTVHGFSGVSERPARLLILDAPAHAAGFFRQVHREVTQMPEDGAKVPGIGLQHGIHFLPPSNSG
jgi:quercetin dioxygenase-like cupin family protein